MAPTRWRAAPPGFARPWRITGTDGNGKPVEVHHHGMEVMRRLPNGEWVFFIDHPWGADPSWAVAQPLDTT
jgi:hypothetical protein